MNFHWNIIMNSLVLALGTATVAGIIGLAAAFGALLIPPRARWVARLVPLLTLALPQFLLLGFWIRWAGGTVPGMAGGTSFLFSLAGGILILSLWLWPVSTLAVTAAWNQLGPGMLEQDPAIRGWSLFRGILWPTAKASWWASWVMISILALNQFTIPTVLQIKVLPEEAWLAFNTRFDARTASMYSLPMVLLPLLLFPWLKGKSIAWTFDPGMAHRVEASVLMSRGAVRWGLGGLALLALISVGLPLGSLLMDPRTWLELPSAWKSSAPSAFQSIVLAGGVATVSLAAGLPLSRWKPSIGLIMLFLFPGFLFGILGIELFNRPGFDWLYPSNLLVGAFMVLRYVGWPVILLSEARRAMDPELQDAARIDGASGWSAFSRVYWPQWRGRAWAGWIIVFLLVLWDVETGVLIVPPGGETLALRVFHLLHYGHNSQVNSLCALLLMIAVTPWIIGKLAPAGWGLARRKLPVRVACGVLALGLAGCGVSEGNTPGLRSQFFDGVQVIGRRGTGPGEFNKPRSLAVDGQGAIYAADMTGRIVKFDSNGHYERFWEIEVSDKGKPKGMAAAAEGGVWVVEPHYTRATRFDDQGVKQLTWGKDGTNAGQLAFPRSIALTPDKLLAVSEYSRVERVQIFSANGERLVRAWGAPGSAPSEFNRAEGLGIAPDGRVFVADSCNHRVQVFTAEGRFLSQFGGAGVAPGQMSYPYDVKVDREGYVFVCEFGNSRVQVFDSKFQSVEILGGAGAKPGQFNNPWSIALDAKGSLYVADSLNHRLQKFTRRGAALSRTQTQTEQRAAVKSHNPDAL